MKRYFWWLGRPGLAGGIDKSGERAAELLALGFGSVEFGSVTCQAIPESNPGLPALLERLAAVDRKKSPKTAIGIGLGLPPGLPAARLADEWLHGLSLLAEVPPVADYVSLNLSAAANRRFVSAELRPNLLAGLAAVAAFRGRQSPAQRPHLAVKLPVEAVPDLWPAFRAAGVEQLTVVLPDGEARLEGLRHLGSVVVEDGFGPALVAVGGIRCAADRQRTLAAGACGIQVHRLFVAEGAATPGLLLAA